MIKTNEPSLSVGYFELNIILQVGTLKAKSGTWCNILHSKKVNKIQEEKMRRQKKLKNLFTKLDFKSKKIK